MIAVSLPALRAPLKLMAQKLRRLGGGPAGPKSDRVISEVGARGVRDHGSIRRNWFSREPVSASDSWNSSNSDTVVNPSSRAGTRG
jgi:hypothetical protein